MVSVIYKNTAAKMSHNVRASGHILRFFSPLVYLFLWFLFLISFWTLVFVLFFFFNDTHTRAEDHIKAENC